MVTPPPYEIAPDFELPDQDGEPRRLSDFRGRNVVLFFYPDDRAPGTASEVLGFRDHEAEFAALDAEIVGISPAGRRSHRRITGNFDLPFLLLSDRRHEASKRYGAWDRRRRRTERATVLVDKDGRVAAAFDDVWPERHADRALGRLEALERSEAWDAPGLPPWLAG